MDVCESKKLLLDSLRRTRENRKTKESENNEKIG